MFASLAPISDDDFNYFAESVLTICGIYLTNAKRELLQTRITPRVHSLGLKSYSEYRRHLHTLPKSNVEWQNLVNAITTNKTDFFREPAHFDFLIKKFLPQWEKANPARKLRIWSAACSTGEEPYTLAMVLEKYFGGKDRFEILATDIDTEVVAHAKNAVYPVARIRELPEEYRSFVAEGSGDVKGWFKVKKNVSNRISFQTKNLLTFPFSSFGTFDIVFCRNVFIYFKAEMIQQITRHFADVTAPGGILCIGHSESIQDLGGCWEHSGPSILSRKSSTASSVVPTPTQAKSPAKLVSPAATTAAPVQRKRKVLIVDDSQTVQRLLAALINKDPNLEVVGTITDPREVDQAIQNLKPDVMTLDMNMPHKDGCQVLEEVMPKYAIPTVMITALAKEEGSQVLRALELGAVDYIQKPSMGEISSMQAIITEKIHTASLVRIKRAKPKSVWQPKAGLKKTLATSAYSRLIAIGSSTGGTEALKDILSELPAAIPPIVIVQHIPANFSKALADRLNAICPFEVKEAEDGDVVMAGRVLIAPGGMQMDLVRSGGDLKVRILDTEPVNRHKPSVDVLFDSVAKEFGPSAIGVILTGMGNDGAKGLLKMRNVGSQTIAQDEESCVVFGMPREAIALGAAQYIEPLNAIARQIVKLYESKPETKKQQKTA
ncbi:MAG: chemotaxis-specific protein-glutamate methyltransferase CheB [Bdellovibrionota bacterium]